MSPAAFLSLAAVTAVAVVGAAIAVGTQPDSDGLQGSGGDLMFQALNDGLDELGEVVVETTSYRLVLARGGEAWVAAGERGNYPVKGDTVAEVVSALASMTTVEPKTANPDWYRYINVGDPAGDPAAAGVRMTTTAANGATLADAIVGRVSRSIGFTRLGGTFVREVDSAQSWLVEGSVTVPGSIPEWFDTILHIPGPDIVRIAVLVGDEIVLDAEKVDLATGDYELTRLSENVGPQGSTANDNGVRGIAQGIVSVKFDEVRPIGDVTVAEDARTDRFVTRNGLQIDVTLAEADGGPWIIIRASAEEGGEASGAAAEVRSRTEQWAFKVPDYRIAALNRPFEQLFFAPGEGPDAPVAPAAIPSAPSLPLQPAAPRPSP